MADERKVLSSRIDPVVNNKLLELVQHYQKQSIGKVTKKEVLEIAINQLHEKELKNDVSI